MVYKHSYLNTVLLLHSIFTLSMVKMRLKGEVGGHALNSHGNYIVDHRKSWKNHRISVGTLVQIVVKFIHHVMMLPFNPLLHNNAF